MLVLMGGVMQVSADNYLMGDWDGWNDTSHKFVFDSNGIGSVTISNLDANTEYQFKIKDDSNGIKYYSYNGDDQVMTIENCLNWTLYTDNNNSKIKTTDPGNYTFKLKWINGDPHIWVIYPTSIKVHFYNNLGWENVGVYRYSSTLGSNEAAWAGTQLSVNTNNLNYYDATLSNNLYDKVIFNNYVATNGEQTTTNDLNLSYPEYWISSDKSQESGNYKITITSTAPEGWVGYTRTVTDGNFGTICLPYAATVTGATIFKITSYIMDDETLTGINIESVTDNAIEAGKAYIFKATGTTLTATYTGGSPSAASEAYGMMGNLFSNKVEVPSGKYIIKYNKIYKAASNVTCGQYKGYITLEGLNETNARGANFISFEDTTTGIANVDVNANIDVDVPMYNLAGQRVSKSYKGVVIVNGKKMLNK